RPTDNHRNILPALSQRSRTMATGPPNVNGNGEPSPDPAGRGRPTGGGDPSLAGNGEHNGHSDLAQSLHQHLLAILSSNRGERLSEEDVRLELHRRLAEPPLAQQAGALSAASQKALIEGIVAEVFGYGPLEALMRDHEITDILINGPHQLYFEKRGRLQSASAAFRDEEHLLQIIQRMLAGTGRRLDEKSRMADARLPEGSRVNIVLTPPALNGPLVSIRRF